jgi:hypothetical protein
MTLSRERHAFWSCSIVQVHSRPAYSLMAVELYKPDLKSEASSTGDIRWSQFALTIFNTAATARTSCPSMLHRLKTTALVRRPGDSVPFSSAALLHGRSLRQHIDSLACTSNCLYELYTPSMQDFIYIRRLDPCLLQGCGHSALYSTQHRGYISWTPVTSPCYFLNMSHSP